MKKDTYKKWCKADTLLLTAFVVFCISLALEIKFQGQGYITTVFEGLHYVADAALVGAIADYFAVTAIFRHPFFGLVKIKGVTAILPSQREKFSKGAVTLLKEELVTTKVLIRAIHKTNLVDKLTNFIRDEQKQKEAVYSLLDIIRDKLEESNQGKYTNELAAAIRNALSESSPRKLILQGIEWLKKEDNGARFFSAIAPSLSDYLKQAKFAQTLKDGYDSLIKQSDKEKVSEDDKGFFSSLLEKGKSILTDKLNEEGVINTGEMAKRTQNQLVKMATELGQKDSTLQNNVIRLVTEHGETLLNDRNFCNSVSEFRKKLLQDAPFEDSLQEVFSYLWKNFNKNETRKSIENKAMNALRSNIAEILREQMVLIVTILGKDEELRASLEKFLREVATLSSVEGRDMATDVINKKLAEKTDEDINSLVWNKFDEDFIFIRINGTLVGAGMGVILFVVTLGINYLSF